MDLLVARSAPRLAGQSLTCWSRACAWLLLRPSRLGPRHQQPRREIAVPVRIEVALPDYVVKADIFDRGLRRVWQPGDRFRMFFGGKAQSRNGVHGTSGPMLCCSSHCSCRVPSC